MSEATSLEDLMRIRAHNRAFLDSINGNLGTALGFKKPTDGDITTHPAIIVFVPLKIRPKWIPEAQLIPKELQGPGGLWCALDVVQGGRAEEEEPVEPSHGELVERLRGWDDQVWAGSQVTHWVNERRGSYSIGTLGAFARRRNDGSLGFLTNQHVGIAPGKTLYHPVPWGTHLGTTRLVVEYVRDEDWYGPFVDEPDTFVRADCAFVELAADFPRQDINPDLMDVGELGPVKPISITDMSIIGQKVQRVGRTTGHRYGRVVAFGYEYIDDREVTVYTDLLIVADNEKPPFSTHGDSGSLIVTDDENRNPVALLWGGWQEKLRTGHGQENWTYGIALSRVLGALDIDLVTNQS